VEHHPHTSDTYKDVAQLRSDVMLLDPERETRLAAAAAMTSLTMPPYDITPSDPHQQQKNFLNTLAAGTATFHIKAKRKKYPKYVSMAGLQVGTGAEAGKKLLALAKKSQSRATLQG